MASTRSNKIPTIFQHFFNRHTIFNPTIGNKINTNSSHHFSSPVHLISTRSFCGYPLPITHPTHLLFLSFQTLPPSREREESSNRPSAHLNMAQKREKEETELKVPENLPICTPPQTIPTPPPQLPAARSTDSSDLKVSSACASRTSSALSPERPDQVENRVLKRPRGLNRCSGSGCRKRIGLMGFRCRCGEVFCSVHRYSDRHDCSYDYKAAGREAIARENPVIRAAKILKV